MAAAITARNRPIHKAADRYLRAGLLNPMERLCFTVIVNLTGAHDYTDARRATIAQRMAGRSEAAETFGAKCLSSIKNYLRKLCDLGLIWIARGRIYIAALCPEPEPEPTAPVVRQLDLFEDLPQEEPTNCPDPGKNMAAPPLRDSDLNARAGGGAGIETEKSPLITDADVPNTPAVQVFRALGTVVPACLYELRDLALDQAQRIAQIVRKKARRDPHCDPGALAVVLARAGVGAGDPPPIAPPPYAAPEADPALHTLWQQIAPQLDLLPWVRDDTTIVHIDPERVVVSASNFLARDRLAEHAGQLAALLSTALDRRVQVELAIGGAT